MNEKDFFLINRKIFDNPIWTLKPFSKGQAWIDLIGLAKYQKTFYEKRGITVILERGQLGFSILGLADRWGWNKKKVETFLKLLQSMQQITYQKNNITTIISITNYDKYQFESNRINNRIDTKGDTEGTQRDTKGDTEGTQRDTVKLNINNINKANIYKEDKTDFDINILPEMQDINNKAEVEVKSVFDIYNMQAEIFPDKLRKSIDYTDKARQNLKTLIIDNKFNRQLFFQKLLISGIDKWKNAPVDFNFWFNNTDFYIKLINGTYDNNNFQKQNNSEETAEKQYPYIDPANYDIKYVFDNGCNGYKFLEITTDKAGNKVMLIFDAKHKRNIIGKVIKENEKEEWKKFEMMMMNKEVKKDKGGKAAYYYV